MSPQSSIHHDVGTLALRLTDPRACRRGVSCGRHTPDLDAALAE